MPAGCLYYTSYELSKERLDQAMPGYTVTVRNAGNGAQRRREAQG